MSNEKNKIEALLFSSGKRMTVEDISTMTGIKDTDSIKQLIGELKIDLEERGGSLAITDDGKHYKMTVKDHYMPVIQRVVSKTELDKPLMETLAVIAWKYPVLQAEVIKIRHNKAYDHLKILEEQGFITRGMFGRTKKITLTEKFFEYFDLPTKDQVRNVFKDIVSDEVKGKLDEIEEDIEEGEKMREEALKKQEELVKKKEELEKSKKEKVDKDKAEIEERLEELSSKEDEEIEKIEEDIKEIVEEEGRDIYDQEKTSDDGADMSSLQESDEVSEPESGLDRKE